MTDPAATSLDPGSRICAACNSDNVGSARFCASCGAMLPSQHTASASSGAATLLADARNHLLAAEWEEAALAAEAVLAFDAASAEAHNIIARARLKQGMRNAALVHAERAVELAPGNAAYAADVALARGGGTTRNMVPALVASAAALLVFIALIALAASRPRNTLPSPDASIGSSDSGRPMAQAPGYPQTFPNPSGSARPRMPAVPSATTAPSAPRSGPIADDAAPAPAPSASAVSGLEPAPVDQTLRAFPGPEITETPKPAAPRTPSPATRRETPSPAPSPGGTNFGPGVNGGTTTTAPRTSPYVYTQPPATSETEPVPMAPVEPQPAQAAPQQHFLDRNYPDAVKGFARMVQEDPDNGVAWQQMALSYSQLGMKSEASQAYREAMAAYARQIAAGRNVDVAQRGIRSCERALQLMAVR